MEEVRTKIWYVQQEDFLSRLMVIVVCSVGLFGAIFLAIGLTHRKFLRNTSGILVLMTSASDLVMVLTSILPFIWGENSMFRVPISTRGWCAAWDAWRGLLGCICTGSLVLMNVDRVCRTTGRPEWWLRWSTRGRLLGIWLGYAGTLLAAYVLALTLGVLPEDHFPEVCSRCMRPEFDLNLGQIAYWNRAYNSTCRVDPEWYHVSHPYTLLSLLLETLVPYLAVLGATVALVLSYSSYNEEYERQKVILANKKKTELALRVAKFNQEFFREGRGEGEGSRAYEMAENGEIKSSVIITAGDVTTDKDDVSTGTGDVNNEDTTQNGCRNSPKGASVRIEEKKKDVATEENLNIRGNEKEHGEKMNDLNLEGDETKEDRGKEEIKDKIDVPDINIEYTDETPGQSTRGETGSGAGDVSSLHSKLGSSVQSIDGSSLKGSDASSILSRGGSPDMKDFDNQTCNSIEDDERGGRKKKEGKGGVLPGGEGQTQDPDPEMGDHPSLTSMTIAVNLLFLVTTLPRLVFNLVRGVFGTEIRGADQIGSYLTWLSLMEFLALAPYTLKFFFYYKHGSEFRNSLKWVMCRNSHPSARRLVSRSTWTTRQSVIRESSQSHEDTDTV